MTLGVSPLDALSFLAVTVLFALVALATSYLPARRDTRRSGRHIQA